MNPNPNGGLAALVESQHQLQEVLAAIARFLRESKDGAQNKIHGFYREARRIVEAFDHGAGLQVRPEILTILVTLDTVTTTNSDSQKLPQTEDFILLQGRGHMQMKDWATEYTIDGPKSRAFVKANNCNIDFRLKDQSSRIYTAKNQICLGSILPEVGGQPMDFMPRDGAPPFVIPHNTMPQVQATLQQTSADVVGGSADYGMSLYGVYISRPDQKR